MNLSLSLHALPGMPLIEPGDVLAPLIGAALRDAGIAPADGDVFVIAQKVVSKAENRFVRLADIEPSARALQLARGADKDPRVVEVILRESKRIVRQRPGVIIAEHRLGLILANAGIDRSNIEAPDEQVLLLPEDPDRSARELRDALAAEFGTTCGVVIADSIGRPWRLGTTGVAIGVAGVPVLEDLRGRPDMFGRKLEVSETATADSLAAAAGLLLGEGDEGTPVILVRGLGRASSTQTAADALRPADEDLFRD